jgi:uncharacterized surface protein with fasciclin (FAS1) repeats
LDSKCFFVPQIVQDSEIIFLALQNLPNLFISSESEKFMRISFKKQLIAAALVVAVSLTVSPTAKANILGTKSLASILTAKSSFDTDGKNFDILTAAVLAVLKAKPNSPVKALTDGSIALTAFIPTDSAFQSLVSRLTNRAAVGELATLHALHGLGIDTLEQVLLYHVVVGAPILSSTALQANGAVLNTALAGKSFAVGVSGTTITLTDQDPLAPNPVVNLSQVDINIGNNQVAHGINAVLLPVALLKPLGTKSLASILTAKNSFDRINANFAILTAAVLAVLKAKPNSPVKVLTEGDVALTAFIPNDAAFKNLVRSLTNNPVPSESYAFKIVASLGIDKVEQILLYHVVPGAPILSETALQANGAVLNTALTGKVIKVSVRGNKIQLDDYNMLRNPKVILFGIDANRGNNQVAHTIDYVLLPTA